LKRECMEIKVGGGGGSIFFSGDEKKLLNAHSGLVACWTGAVRPAGSVVQRESYVPRLCSQETSSAPILSLPKAAREVLVKKRWKERGG
jgi:hypothetical protein